MQAEQKRPGFPLAGKRHVNRLGQVVDVLGVECIAQVGPVWKPRDVSLPVLMTTMLRGASSG